MGFGDDGLNQLCVIESSQATLFTFLFCVGEVDSSN